MNIQQGLFQFDLTDYHAILGVPIDADAKQIRKRYLKIARKLHPDSFRTGTDEDRRKANELLSKFVNPAYEVLTQEKQMTEHLVVLRMRGQQLSRDRSAVKLETDAARGLLNSNDATPMYTNTLQQLAEDQYESLEGVSEITGKISELNLAYIVSSAGRGTATTAAQATAASAPPKAASPPAGQSAATAKTPPAPPSPKRQREVIMESYLNRAAEFALKKDYSRAILEMREGIKSHPTNPQFHSQLAQYYLQAGQAKMAKIHVKRAMELDPENSLANELDAKLEKAAPKQKSQAAAKNVSTKSKGGLFGLFGGRQK